MFVEIVLARRNVLKKTKKQKGYLAVLPMMRFFGVKFHFSDVSGFANMRLGLYSRTSDSRFHETALESKDKYP